MKRTPPTRSGGKAQRAPKPPSQATVRKPESDNAKDAQRTKPTRPPHPGEEERIAERRAQALVLRKGGASYRTIAERLEVDVATAWSDVQAELTALRMLATSEAEDVKALELQRLDALTAGLFVKATQSGGDPAAVNALIRVSERRARLLGLDAPTKLSGPNGEAITPAVIYLPENHRSGTT